MILILGEKDIVNKIQNIRKKIQQEKNIHLGDSITLNQFKELYKEYGAGLEKRIFARYVLDIPYSTLRGLIKKSQKTTPVFTMEKINEEYIENIKQKLIKEHNLHICDEINYEQLIQLYNSIETVYGLKMFASEILEINSHTLSILKSKTKSNKKVKIFSRTNVSNSKILEIREKIKKEYHLEENDEITIKQFEEIYQKYGGMLRRIEFAQRVLEINRTSLNKLKNKGEEATTKILTKNEKLLKDSEIDLIRKEIVQEYNLHIDDLIDYETFKQIYSKYKQRYTEKQLSEDVFGTPLGYFTRGTTTRIFQRVQLSKENIKYLRDIIIKEKKLHSEDKITYEELERLHKQYGGILSINQFAIKILDILETQIPNMKSGQNATILKNEYLSLEELEKITQKIVKDYGLHIKDIINHEQFIEMYEKYGGRLSKRQFSEDVLDISYDLISERSDFRSIILSSTIISEEYIEDLIKRILKETKLKIRQKIDYKKFCEIDKQYGGDLREIDFAELILQVSKSMYYIIKENKDDKATIFTNVEIDETEYDQLKDKILEENNLHIKDFIDYIQFLEVYNQYDTSLNEQDFARIILGLSQTDYNNIKYRENSKARILKNEKISEEEIKQKREFFKKMEGKRINYNQLRIIHKQYGGKMNEAFFCEQILGFNLNYIKYYEVNATIKDPIAKQKSIEIRKRVENEPCRFFTKEEINKLCEEYNMSEKEFLNYVVLKYNFKFYNETEESLRVNNGIWFGAKKIPLTQEFINKFSERLFMLATGITKNLAKIYKVNKYIQEDVIQELMLKAMEEYGELERNFSYNIENCIKRICIRMRTNAKHIICSHFKLQNKNISERYYFKEREGAEIQLIDVKTNVEDDAIEKATTEEKEFSEKVVSAIKILSKNGNSDNEIQYAIMNYLGIERTNLIKILKSRCSNIDTYNYEKEVINFVKQIIAEYNKRGIEIDSQEAVVIFYIQQITELNNVEDKVVNDIIQAAKICQTNKNCEPENMKSKRDWKEIEKELKDNNIDIRTICMASNIYNEKNSLKLSKIRDKGA